MDELPIGNTRNLEAVDSLVRKEPYIEKPAPSGAGPFRPQKGQPTQTACCRMLNQYAIMTASGTTSRAESLMPAT